MQPVIPRFCNVPEKLFNNYFGEHLNVFNFFFYFKSLCLTVNLAQVLLFCFVFKSICDKKFLVIQMTTLNFQIQSSILMSPILYHFKLLLVSVKHLQFNSQLEVLTTVQLIQKKKSEYLHHSTV